MPVPYFRRYPREAHFGVLFTIIFVISMKMSMEPPTARRSVSAGKRKAAPPPTSPPTPPPPPPPPPTPPSMIIGPAVAVEKGWAEAYRKLITSPTNPSGGVELRAGPTTASRFGEPPKYDPAEGDGDEPKPMNHPTDPAVGDPQLSDGENARRIEQWELRFNKYHRAKYFQDKGMDGPSRCLPDGTAAVGGMDSWRSRVLPEGSFPPFTDLVQERIWRHQHPMSCTNQRFLVWRLWNEGMGATLHSLAQGLNIAVRTNRVLVLDDEYMWLWAMDRYPSSLECFFASVSNCTLDDAGDYEVYNPGFGTATFASGKKYIERVRRLIEAKGARSVANPVRKVGEPKNAMLNPAPYADLRHLGHQWWTAQGVRYVLREMQPWFKEVFEGWVRRTLPDGIPKKMVGMHVRHGDKYKEMKLIGFEKYMERFEKLRAAEPDLNAIMLSTEDPGVLEEAMKISQAKGYKFYWTDNWRYNDGSPMDYARMIGPSKLTEISFVNLLLQELYCTHWIGTEMSNWNRLINEMRLTNGRYGWPYEMLNTQRCYADAAEKSEGEPPLVSGGWVVPGWQAGC